MTLLSVEAPSSRRSPGEPGCSPILLGPLLPVPRGQLRRSVAWLLPPKSPQNDLSGQHSESCGALKGVRSCPGAPRNESSADSSRGSLSKEEASRTACSRSACLLPFAACTSRSWAGALSSSRRDEPSVLPGGRRQHGPALEPSPGPHASAGSRKDGKG